MNYRIEVRDTLVLVEELATEQILKCYSSEQEANNLVLHLNEGGGFDGNTPPFFLRETGLPSFITE